MADKWMQSWLSYKSLKAVSFPIYKSNSHPHYVVFQNGKFEGFPFNFNFYTFYHKQNKVLNEEENQLDKYYCEFKTLWIMFS